MSDKQQFTNCLREKDVAKLALSKDFAHVNVCYHSCYCVTLTNTDTLVKVAKIKKKQERTPLLPKVSKQETTTAQSRIVVTVSSK